MIIAFDGSNLSIYLNDELKSSIIYKSDFPMQRIIIGQSKEDMQNFIGLFDELSIILRTTSFNRLASIRGYSDNYVYNKYKNIRS